MTSDNPVAKFVDWLTRPHDSIVDTGQRNQSRLLAAIYLLLIPLGLIVIVIQRIIYNNITEFMDPYLFLEVGIVVCFLIGYFLNRLGQYIPAIVYSLITLTIVIFLLTYSVANSSGSEKFLMYLVIPVMIAFVFLPLPIAIVFAAFVTVMAVGFAWVVPGVPLTESVFVIFGYLVVVFMVIIIMTYYQNELSNLRRMEIAEKEARFRTIFEGIPDVSLVVNTRNGKVFTTNNTVTPVLGYSMDGIKGKKFPKLLENIEDKDTHKNIVSLIAKGTDIGTVDVKKKDGSLIPMDIRGAPLPWENEDMILVIMRDMTERKRSRENLMAEKQRAELYLDVMGHDVTNQNQAIVTTLGMLLLDENLTAMQRDDLRLAQKQSWTISNLVKNVKRITQLNSESIELRDVDAAIPLKDAIKKVKSANPGTRIRINNSIKEGEVMIKADDMLFTVFSALLENAIKFNRNQVIEIDIRHYPEGKKKWRLEFVDNGTGVSDEFKELIFKRLEIDAKSLISTGLGLAMVDRVMKLYGGKIWVEDRVEGDHTKGSDFVLLFKKGE